MPALWKRMAAHVAEGYEKKGMPTKQAESYGYATATKMWKKLHGGQTPQMSAGETKKRRRYGTNQS